MNAKTFIAQSARLDAIAARATTILQKAYPDWAPTLERNLQDEIRHARVLSELSRGVHVDPAYAEAVAKHLSDDPFTVALTLNLIERQSIRQFRLAYRQTGIEALGAIAQDEKRHVKVGTNLIRDVRPLRLNVGTVLGWLHKAQTMLQEQGMHRLLVAASNDLDRDLRES